MKSRPEGFIKPESISPDQFDYIVELHEYLWRFVRVAFPDAIGDLTNLVDPAIEKLEQPQEDLAKLIEQIRQELLDCEDPRDLIIWLADILNVDL